jgi:hypothetical protein
MTWELRTMLDTSLGQTPEGRNQAFAIMEQEEITLRNNLKNVRMQKRSLEREVEYLRDVVRRLRDGQDVE